MTKLDGAFTLRRAKVCHGQNQPRPLMTAVASLRAKAPPTRARQSASLRVHRYISLT